MKRCIFNVPRCIMAVLVCVCTFGNLFPFLNIDLGFVIMTPFRFVLALVSIFCVGLWIRRIKQKQALQMLKNMRLELGVLCFLIVWLALGVAQIVFAGNRTGAVTEITGILTICMLAFCAFTLIKSSKDMDFLLDLLVLCGVIFALLAWVEMAVGNFVPGTKYYFTLEQRIEQGRIFFPPTIVFHNPNDFAAFLLLCLSVVCYRVISAKTTEKLLLGIVVALVLIAPAVVINSTFFNLFAGCLVVITVAAILLVKSISWKTRVLRATGVCLVAIIFALFITGGIRNAAVQLNRSYFTEKIQAYYNEKKDDIDAPTQDVTQESTEGLDILDGFDNGQDTDNLLTQLDALKENRGTVYIRLNLMRAGVDFWLESPIFGNGPASFVEKMQHSEYHRNQTAQIVDPHCFYFELLTQYGAVLFVAYMGIVLYVAVKSLLRTIRQIRGGVPARGLLSLLMIGMFSLAVFIPSSCIRFTNIWVFLIFAICVYCKDKSVTHNENG